MIHHSHTPTPYGTPWTWEQTFDRNSPASAKAFVVAGILSEAGYEVTFKERAGHRGVITRIRKGTEDLMGRAIRFQNPRRCLPAGVIALLDQRLA